MQHEPARRSFRVTAVPALAAPLPGVAPRRGLRPAGLLLVVLAAACASPSASSSPDDGATCMGGGFSTTPLSWNLPHSGITYGTSNFTCGSAVYSTLDMSGDSKPDLVVASECTASSTVGQDHWLVYANTCP